MDILLCQTPQNQLKSCVQLASGPCTKKAIFLVLFCTALHQHHTQKRPKTRGTGKNRNLSALPALGATASLPAQCLLSKTLPWEQHKAYHGPLFLLSNNQQKISPLAPRPNLPPPTEADLVTKQGGLGFASDSIGFCNRSAISEQAPMVSAPLQLPLASITGSHFGPAICPDFWRGGCLLVQSDSCAAQRQHNQRLNCGERCRSVELALTQVT